ncbi:sulfotransferase family protein [Haloarcula amylovorans]|uniref:sulfotransferase n=1 Tax=Haloarcula amylovorans TaxID=2562280 RepID=UPI001075EF6A|nr:sulfotransferase [Halomicroarcula amylolytica]
MSLEQPLNDARQQAQTKSQTVRDEVVSAEKRAILSEHRADDFDSVLLVASASRGGSSLLFDTLRHHERTCSPDGEHGKWYTFNGICYPEFDSDRIPADFDSFDRDALLTDLLADVGATAAEGDRTHRIDDTLVRLPLQFPERDLPYGEMREAMMEGASLDEVLRDHGVSPKNFDEFAEEDTDERLNDEAIEERPFITSHDHKRGLRDEDFDRTLVLKTSVDAYRLPWIREQLFPDTDVDLVHLTRNPAASINGLYDGWRLNRGFQTYDVGDLDLEDYDGALWNYDLPPGWFSDGQLIDACLQQWTQAQGHILEGRDAFDDVHRVRFEDLITDTESTIEGIVDFAGLGESELLRENAEDLNQVMTTKEPERARWRNREGLVRGALDRADEPFDDVVERLGYTDESEWI